MANLQKNSQNYLQGQKDTAILTSCFLQRRPCSGLNLKIPSSIFLSTSSKLNFHITSSLATHFRTRFCKYFQKRSDVERGKAANTVILFTLLSPKHSLRRHTRGKARTTQFTTSVGCKGEHAYLHRLDAFQSFITFTKRILSFQNGKTSFK